MNGRYYGLFNVIQMGENGIVDLKITDLAEITYTSPSTISRFCKKIGEKTITTLEYILPLQ